MSLDDFCPVDVEAKDVPAKSKGPLLAWLSRVMSFMLPSRFIACQDIVSSTEIGACLRDSSGEVLVVLIATTGLILRMLENVTALCLFVQ